MTTSVVDSSLQLAEFLEAAEGDLGDAAAAVCLMLARWSEGPAVAPGLIARWDGTAVQLQVVQPHGAAVQFELRINEQGPVIDDDGTLQAFGVRKVTGGAWAFEPSLNMPGVLHGFIIMTGVPDPPPWKQRVILGTEDVIRAISRRRFQ